MSKELVIGSNRHETKVAILEEDQLVEVYFQRGQEYSLAGSIHKGRVTRVLPGMQSAFVDLGLERDTFLYVSDFFEENEDIDTVTDDVPVKTERRDQRRGGERGGSDRMQGDRNQSTRHQPEQLADRSGDDDDVSKVQAIDSRPVLSDSIPFLDEDQEPESIASPLETSISASEGDRVEGDPNRTDRSGNRRGRRRRPRGRGFPDNKYAQPSGLSSSSEPPPTRVPPDHSAAERTSLERLPGEKIGGDRPSFDRAYADRGTLDRIPSERSGNRRPNEERSGGDRNARREDSTPFEAAEPTDGIILPGESLAKYRKLAAADSLSPARSYQPVEAQQSAPDPVELPSTVPLHEEVQFDPIEEEELSVEDLAAEQEAIKHEAAELELTDRIFSHHELQDLPEEEKLADIEIERLDVEATESSPQSFHSEVYEPLPIHHADESAPPRYEEFAIPFDSTSTVEVTGPIVIFAEPHPTDETHHIESHHAESHQTDEPLATYEATAPLGLSTDGEDDELEGETAFAEPDQLTGEARLNETPQTANLRDPNGRSMHRNSRRSRRRRGGNRFSSPVDAAAPATAGPVPTLGLAVAGTAPAMEPIEIRRELPETRPERAERPERIMPSISDLLKAGQEIIVQIAKEPLGQKGARITSHIALPGRYVVFMPSVTHLGVSRKVESDEERQRLKQILQKHRSGTTGGFIVRTAGEGVPEDEIAADMNFLYNLWLDIRQKAEKKPAPMLLHYDLDIVQRILRDQVTEDYKAIWVDNEDMYESVVTFMQRFQPTLVSRVKMYTREAPIFDAFNITQELEKALRPKVWLKSGGYIVINQTEALVAIDINTGKYVGKSNRLEDTIVKTNTEAVKEIVRQVRLRDLGGIIVVDFIDMDERKNRQKVMAALEEAMESDKAPYKILQFNDFGLVAITRKRVKQSLERTLCSPCPYCEGAGYVKSVQTTIGEILAEAQKISRAIDSKDVVLRVHPEVAKVLKASNNKFLEEIEEILKRPVLVTGDATLHTEKFDLA